MTSWLIHWLWTMPRRWGRELRVLAALFVDWPLAVRHHYGLLVPKTPPLATFRLRSGEVFQVDPGPIDVSVLKSIWGDRIYETFPGFAPQPGWTVLDLGAHKGAFALRAARAGATVHALEPERHNLALLQANLARNPPTGRRVHVLAGAVAAERGRGELLRRTSWSHGLEPQPDDAPDLDRDPVALLPLDALIAAAGPAVDLVKLDVEGAELPALRAASAAALARVRRLVLEYHPLGAQTDEQVGQRLHDLLTGHGFRCRRYPYNTLFADRPED